MTNAESLGRLAEEMAGAYEERAHLISHIKQGNNELKQETGDLLSGFSKSRKEMGNELKSELTKSFSELKDDTVNMLNGFHASRKEMGNELKSELTKGFGELKDNTANMLNGFHTSHEEMGNELKSELTKGFGELKDNTANMLNGFHTSRKEMGNELKSELTKSFSELKDDTANMLNEFHTSRKEMGNELKSELTKGKAELKQETVNMLNEFQRSLKEIAKEIGDTKKAWNELSSKMRSVRGRNIETKPVEAEASREEKHVEEAIEERHTAKVGIKEVFSDKEESDEKGASEDRILEVVGNNQGGLKMVDIADNLGVQNWRSLIPIMRELLDDGKLQKSEDSLYYI